MMKNRFNGSGSNRRRAALSSAVALVGIGLLSAPVPASADQVLPFVGGNGGTQQQRTCPAATVMTGASARVGQAIDAVRPFCREVRTNGTIGNRRDPVEGASFMGGGGGTVRGVECPSGHVVMGQFIASGGLPNVVHRLGLGCKLWDAGQRRVTGALSTVKIETPFGSTIGSNAGSSCSNTSEPVRRMRTRAGTLVDAAGLTCIRP